MSDNSIKIRYGGESSWVDFFLLLLPVIFAATPQLAINSFGLSLILLIFSGLILIGLVLIFCLFGFDSKAWIEGSRIQFPLMLSGFFLGQVVWFSSLYLIIQSVNPDAFNQVLNSIGAFYFSLSILTTTGFGDIHALSNGARIAVSLEMLCSVLTIIVLISTAASKAFNEK